MEVNDYVRTKYGKIINIQVLQIIKDINCDYVEINYEKILRNNIVKSSPKIIDLIQVGDYVNGWRVMKKNDDYFFVGDENEGTWHLLLEDIKSIVTKEQFESMKYKVEE